MAREVREFQLPEESVAIRGFRLLAEFLAKKEMSVAALHRGLVERFGKRVKYSRVLSWARATRVPRNESIEWLRLACDIDPDAWLTPAQIDAKKWSQKQKSEGATAAC